MADPVEAAAPENETQPVDVLQVEVPVTPPAAALSPTLDANERRLKYQKVSPKDSETKHLGSPTAAPTTAAAEAPVDPDDLPEEEETPEVLQGGVQMKQNCSGACHV